MHLQSHKAAFEHALWPAGMQWQLGDALNWKCFAGGFIPEDSLKATTTVDQNVTFEYTWQVSVDGMTMLPLAGSQQ